MTIRLATYNDLDEIRNIFLAAKEKMVKDGNLEQWKNIDYPFCYTKEDIDKKQCYVVVNDNNELVVLSGFCEQKTIMN